MKKFLFFAAAVAALLTSCQKEKGSDDSSAKVVKTITASIGNSTKVVMGEDDGTVTKLNWEEGDNLLLINIHFVGEIPEFSSSKYSANNSGETTTFDFVEGTAISPDDMHYAYYPYEKMQYSAPEGVFNYSDSQTYTQDSFDKSAMPMFALNVSGTNFTFDAMAPVLRLKVKLATAISDVIVNSVVIESADNYLSGTSKQDDGFNEPEENTGKSITLDCGEGVAINNTDATQFCIVLPPNTYDEGDLKITVKTNKGNIVKTSNAEATFAAGKVYNINVSGDPTPALPAGALPGIFSVSETKKVYFSQGNLQATYDGTKYTWGFAANQNDYIGNAAGNTTIDSQTNSSVVDLFGWSTSATNYGINTSTSNNDYSGSFVDWGSTIDNKGTWRTLSGDELYYLLYTREVNGGTEGGHSFSKIIFGGKQGLVLYPDDYTGSPLVQGTNYSALPEGVVFLPLAGIREGSEVSEVDNMGYYWSSSKDEEEEEGYVVTTVWLVWIEDGYPGMTGGPDSFWGQSVRLVTDAN